MRLLAIDTALTNCAVAALETGHGANRLYSVEDSIGRGHAERLMPMIREVMAKAGMDFTMLDRVAVTTGPGSFTGLRVGLSVARGIGLVIDRPVVGVSTLEALAQFGVGEKEVQPILAVLEGKVDEVYCQSFEHDGTAIDAPCVRTISELAQTIKPCTRLIGSAAHRLFEACANQTLSVVSEQAYPSITHVASLGTKADPRTALPSPLYLRPPDASPSKKAGIVRQ